MQMIQSLGNRENTDYCVINDIYLTTNLLCSVLSPHLAGYLCIGSVLRLSGNGPVWLVSGQTQLHLNWSECVKGADLAV